MSQRTWSTGWELERMRTPIGSTLPVSTMSPVIADTDGTGSWIIHPMLILLGKVLVGALPGMTQDLSWTVTNLGYMAVSHLSVCLQFC